MPIITLLIIITEFRIGILRLLTSTTIKLLLVTGLKVMNAADLLKMTLYTQMNFTINSKIELLVQVKVTSLLVLEQLLLVKEIHGNDKETGYLLKVLKNQRWVLLVTSVNGLRKRQDIL